MYKKRFYTLYDHCQQNNIKVGFVNDKEDFCYPKLNMIFISERSNWKHKLFALMHEIGHIEIYKNRESWEKDFTCFSVDITDGRKRRSIGYQVSLIAEEIDAWRVGKQVALSCGISFDNEEYNKFANNCVFSYIRNANSSVNN